MSFVIEPLSQPWLDGASRVHSASWQESHRAFCSEAFVAAHTPQRQRAWLLEQMAQGKRFYILREGACCLGLVSEQDGLIENLYVDPQAYRRGIGSVLLKHVCLLHKHPRLWVLSNNDRAIALYRKHGFCFTGRTKRLNDTLCELEMEK